MDLSLRASVTLEHNEIFITEFDVTVECTVNKTHVDATEVLIDGIHIETGGVFHFDKKFLDLLDKRNPVWLQELGQEAKRYLIANGIEDQAKEQFWESYQQQAAE